MSSKAASGKPPKIKPISFPGQALGSSSAPLVATLSNTTGKALTVTAVAVSGDFSQNNGCVGQLPAGANCYISVVFTPTRSGTRKGTLTVTTSGSKVSASIVGVGQVPTILSATSESQAALSQITFNVSGFAAAAPVEVSFAEKLSSGKKGLALAEAAGQSNGALIAVVVPPVIDPTSGELVTGSATAVVQELLPSGAQSSKSLPLKIGLPAVSSSLPPGVMVADFLAEEQTFATQLAGDVQGTQLGTGALESALSQIASQSGALLAALNSSASGTELGSVGGVDVTVGQADLTTADNQLLNMLATLANQGGSQAAARYQAGTAKGAQSGVTGCLAAEAAAALSDNRAGNAAAFANDVVRLFEASESSAACRQPANAAAAAGIVNGSGAVSLGFLAQGGGAQFSSALPAQALGYANLGPAGQLIAIGVALAQTGNQAAQSVVGSVKTFNQSASKQLTTVISNTQGAPLHNSYAATSMTATSLDVAAPPFNGAYSGTFSGTQFFSGGNSCPITGALDLSASGTTITTTAPGAGSGTLNDSSGVASFTITGLADPNATCTFNGTFAVDTAGAATASGTWSCSVSGTSASGFTSANGTWSLSRQ